MDKKPIRILYTVNPSEATDEYYYHCKGLICKHKRNFTFIEPAEIGEQFKSKCYFCNKMITFEVVIDLTALEK